MLIGPLAFDPLALGAGPTLWMAGPFHPGAPQACGQHPSLHDTNDAQGHR
jgi:hypothetical protein